jgi:multiple sugar transport system substrate-binding protein
MAAVFAVACTAGSKAPTATSGSQGGSEQPVTITIWSEWTAKREIDAFNKIFSSFEQRYPWITVKSVTGVNDTKIIAAINSGAPPDVVLSFSLDNVGKFCQSGAWQDLTPFIQSDKLDLSQFPKSVFQYTSFAGKQCALPFLTDVYGLYYNKDMFANAGISGPPKTTEQLVADAEKLTVFNSDGSIKVAGFVPWDGYYEVNPVTFGSQFGAQWYDQGVTRSALASDPRWADMLTWQKELVDFYGAANLEKFVAGSGDEFSSNQDFEVGRTAMNLDGEWRTAFIKAEHPSLNYATAPFPVPSNLSNEYGMGQIGGTIIGVPRGSARPNEAWDLVKWMATDTTTLVNMANLVSNVPTTYAALKSPDLAVSPQFRTFLNVFRNRYSHYKQSSPLGSADQDLVASLMQRWQAGQVPDLGTALAQIAQQIDDALQQAQGP